MWIGSYHRVGSRLVLNLLCDSALISMDYVMILATILAFSFALIIMILKWYLRAIIGAEVK